MAQLQFWYEFASNYSYLSAMRVEELARKAGVEVDWRPFLLGPIFKSQGWHTSPFNLFPAKGRHMVRDMQRIAAARGIPFVLPNPFPPNGLQAARLAYVGKAEGWIAPFTRAVFAAEFGSGEDISDPAVLGTPELAIAVAEAGGLGSFPCAILGPDQMRADVSASSSGWIEGYRIRHNG
jgi:2-hydroxychromene-2-carboxylate isomerase